MGLDVPSCMFTEKDLLTDSSITMCSSRDSLVKAIQDGQLLGPEGPFEPRGCNIPWPQRQEFCSVLNRFTSLTFISDIPELSVALALVPMISWIQPEGIVFCDESLEKRYAVLPWTFDYTNWI